MDLHESHCFRLNSGILELELTWRKLSRESTACEMSTLVLPDSTTLHMRLVHSNNIFGIFCKECAT